MRLYDPKGKGTLIDLQADGFEGAIARTQALLQFARPIFEAGFYAEGARAFADVMLPVRKNGKRMWRVIEVKSSTSVKDYHRDDVATQAFIAHPCGVPLLALRWRISTIPGRIRAVAITRGCSLKTT
ncbi:MAG: hypothetical protein AMXMBFR76_12860 [Pseudomonadota bacterium]